jgi:ribosomal protein S18 acetylase RimI-like enzyme
MGSGIALLRVVTFLCYANFARPLALVGKNVVNVNNIQFRSGVASDEFPISLQLGKELMNPLGVQAQRFVVAETEDGAQRIGWAQIRPLGRKAVDPNRFDARPGSLDIQEEAEDEAWEAFEKDETAPVPKGLASLPWTKEYRAFSEASDRRKGQMEQQRKRREMWEAVQPQAQLYELASVWVSPDYRGQGIGTDLVRRVLCRHVEQCGGVSSSLADIYLLTLASTEVWYRDNVGFQIVKEDKEIPAQMSFEVAAGGFITKVIGQELICMRGDDMMASKLGLPS